MAQENLADYVTPVNTSQGKQPRPMRIAILSPYPTFPFQHDLGCRALSFENNATWTVALAHALAQIPDTEVHVLTEATDITHSRIITTDNTHLHFIKAPDRFKTLTLWRFDRYRLHRALAEIQPDLVHGQGLENQYGYAAVTAPYPHLLTIHGLPRLANIAQQHRFLSRGRLTQFLSNRTLRLARNIVVINPFVTECLPLATPTRRLFPIPNAIAVSFFNSAPIAREPNLILSIGWLDRRKAPDILLRALALLKQRGLNPKAVIAGPPADPRFLAGLRQFAATEKLSVEFPGFVTPAQVESLLKRCTLLVSPARHETAPMVIAEALALGTPVIASAVGGCPHMIRPGVTGQLFQSENFTELADKIHDLLTHPATREQLSAAARHEAAQTYHPNLIAQQTRAAYAAILKDAPA